jgi:hypothetical protein
MGFHEPISRLEATVPFEPFQTRKLKPAAANDGLAR